MPILRLKDGTRLRVKEGADYDAVYKRYMSDQAKMRQDTPEFQAKVEARRAADREEYNPTKGMSGVDKFLAGMGQGTADVVRSVGNMVGLVDDQTITDADERDAPLRETGAGAAGSFVGNVAATGLATMPLGAALSGLRGAGALTNTLRAGAGNVAAQGALAGAINARPNQRGSGAALGAALGAGTYGALMGAGRLASGLVKKSDDALALEAALPGTEVPLHISASPDDPVSRTFKTVYGLGREAPISGTLLRKQEIGATDDLIGTIGRRSVPQSLGIDDLKFTSGQTPAERASNQANVVRVKEAISELLTPLKPKLIKRSGKFWNETVGKVMSGDGKKTFGLSRTHPEVFREIQDTIDDAIPPDMAEIRVESILNAISRLKKLRNKYGGSDGTGKAQAIDEVVEAFKEMGRKRFSALDKKLAPQWEKAMQLQDEFWGWENFQRAVAKPGDGSISTKGLISSMKGGAASKAQGRMPNQQLAQLGNRVMVDEAERLGGGFKTGVALGAGAGAMLAPGATMAAGAILPMLATKTGQRVLTGGTAGQKILAEALRRNPALMQKIASGLVPITSPRGE